MFIDEECGILKVVADGGELNRNISRKKKSDVKVVNKLKGRELFLERMNRDHLDLILGRHDRNWCTMGNLRYLLCCK